MHRSSTILIVDDNESGRKTIDNLLYGSGYDLVFAENGYEALEKAETCLPDLILLDVMMPGMDGFEVCRRLRANPLVSEIPILIVTMLDDNESRLQGLNAGADDFISKPFNSAELEARVNTITRLNRYRRLVSERNKLEWALNQADSGFIILDSDGNITFANSLAAKYFGTQTLSEEKSDFISLVKAHFLLEPEELWQQWIDGESPDYGELILVKPETDFSKKQWLKMSYLIEHVDKQSRQVLKFTDVTHQVTTSYNMRTFIATVSHKLRTPLTSMIMNFEMFAKSNGMTKNEDALSLKEDIENLRVAVEDVLAYSQASLLAYSGWNITFEDLESIIKGIFANRDVDSYTIKIDPMPERAYFPIADLPLTIILEELTENAKKFHPQKQPVIDIIIKLINPLTISLTFTDDGVNLPPEHISNLLIPFYQAEKEFTGGTGGMGLGLPIVASIVWEIGGKCRIKNRLDRPGITVELILPINNEHES